MTLFHTPWSLFRIAASFSSWFCIISFCLLVSCTSSLMPFFLFSSCKTEEKSKCDADINTINKYTNGVKGTLPPVTPVQWSVPCRSRPCSLSSCWLSCFPFEHCSKHSDRCKKTDNRQSWWWSTVIREAVRYLWMMLLSYSSPSGVSMMAYSSLVTWSRAGRESPSVMWLIICGNNLFGERQERAPTAFFTAWGEKCEH